MRRSLIAFAGVLSVCALVHAQATPYVVTLNGEMESFTPYFQNSTFYCFFPNIQVHKSGVASTASLTIVSPSSAFFGGYDNGALSASSEDLATTGDILSRANGTWTAHVVDGGDTFDYSFDMAVSLPFSDLPVLSSPEFVNGGNYPASGTFHFGVAGGNATYPGPAMRVTAGLFATDFSTNYETDLLAAGASSWTPTADLTGVSQVLASMFTTNEAIDSTALAISNIQSLTPNAPGLEFDAATVVYASDTTSILNVPEPASIGLMAIGMLSLVRRKR